MAIDAILYDFWIPGKPAVYRADCIPIASTVIRWGKSEGQKLVDF